jgi:hypothetical protein
MTPSLKKADKPEMDLGLPQIEGQIFPFSGSVGKVENPCTGLEGQSQSCP